MPRRTAPVIVATLVALLSTFIPPGLAQQDSGSAEVADSLVYSGRLEFLDQPVTRLIDLRLVPYGTATGGDPLTPPLERTQILPVEGWFEVLLDLPAGVLSSNHPTWLQIAVRPSNAEEPYVVLEPRQLLTTSSDGTLPAGVRAGVTDPNASPSAFSEAQDVPSQPGAVPPSSPDGSYQVSQDGIETAGQPGIPPDDGVLPPELEFEDWEDDGNDPQGCGWAVVGGGLQTLCHVGIGAAPSSRNQLVVIANDEDRAITAGNLQQTDITFGTVSSANSNQGRGVLGIAWAKTGPTYGIVGRAKSSAGKGVAGFADSRTGVNYGVLGWTASPDGFGGYFVGPRNYFSGMLGIGTQDPTHRLTVDGPIRSMDGGFVFPDGSVQATAAGSGDWESCNAGLKYPNRVAIGPDVNCPDSNIALRINEPSESNHKAIEFRYNNSYYGQIDAASGPSLRIRSDGYLYLWPDWDEVLCANGSGYIDLHCRKVYEHSSREFKSDIDSVSESEQAEWLDAIRQMRPVSYVFNNDLERETLRRDIGFIAEELPAQLVTEDQDAVSVYGLTTVALMGVKELDRRIEQLKESDGVVVELGLLSDRLHAAELQIDRLTTRNSALEVRLAALETQLAQLLSR